MFVLSKERLRFECNIIYLFDLICLRKHIMKAHALAAIECQTITKRLCSAKLSAQVTCGSSVTGTDCPSGCDKFKGNRDTVRPTILLVKPYR